MKRFKYFILAFFVLLIIIFTVVFLISPSIAHRKKVKESRIKQQQAGVGYIRSSLDLYYVNYSRYPNRILEMKDTVNELEDDSYAVLLQSIGTLDDFTYEIRGDDQAYRFTYINPDGEKVIEQRNYRTDFHKTD